MGGRRARLRRDGKRHRRKPSGDEGGQAVCPECAGGHVPAVCDAVGLARRTLRRGRCGRGGCGGHGGWPGRCGIVSLREADGPALSTRAPVLRCGP
ncbi:hypothetical protein BER2_0400 [plant metagenome]|uniref:Uncharacterized protein n=1 Tax=plant metagenome TaxID=1297885 RepID=A0A484PTE0_9ZZZZ